MVKKRTLFFTFLLIFLVFLFWLAKEKRGLTPNLPETIKENLLPTPTSITVLTKYTNQEFGFSLAYPAEWSLPKETKITPPQQHLYQIILNPGGVQYFIDIYHQMMPLPLANFIRDYFPDVSWSEEQKINGQNTVKFFWPKNALEPAGTAGIAFAKGNNVLFISTSIMKGSKGDIINDAGLNQLAESFTWQE